MNRCVVQYEAAAVLARFCREDILYLKIPEASFESASPLEPNRSTFLKNNAPFVCVFAPRQESTAHRPRIDP